MMPSASARISSQFSTASGFSILAMIGMWRPDSSMRLRTVRTSRAFRTKDRAM